MNLIEFINKWTENKLKDRLIHRYGGIQYCPWCKQIVQKYENTTLIPHNEYDEIVCGNCEGSSHWRFEIGMIFIGNGKFPTGIKNM